MNSRRRTAALLGAIVLVLAACSGDAAEPGPTSGGEAGGAPASTTPGENGGSGQVDPGPSPAEVLRFSAPKLGGGTIEGEDFAGDDVAFWFWAPW